MDSDDNDFMYDEDELSDPEDDQDDFDISCDVEAAGEPSAKRHMKDEDEFSYDSLTPESIVVTMKKSIDEVNSVFEVAILNYFHHLISSFMTVRTCKLFCSICIIMTWNSNK